MAAPLLETTPLVSKAAPYLCFRERGYASVFTFILIFITVAIKEGSNGGLPSSLPELSAIGIDTRLLPGIHTVCYAFGKLSGGVLTFFIGPRMVLILAMLLSSLGGLCVLSTDQMLLCIGTGVSAYANAHVWGSASRVVAQWSQDGEIGRSVGLSLGLANDLGTMIFTVIFSTMQLSIPPPSVLHATSPYLLMTALSLVNVLALLLLLRSSAVEAGFPPPVLAGAATEIEPKTGGGKGVGGEVAAGSAASPHGGLLTVGEHPMDRLALLPAVRELLGYGRVRVFMVATGLGTIGSTSFTYTTTYARNVLQYDDHQSTLLLTAYTLGLIMGCVVVGWIVDKLRAVPNAVLVVNTVSSICVSVTVGTILILHISGQHALIGAAIPALAVLIGFPIALLSMQVSAPLHLPPSLSPSPTLANLRRDLC